MYGGNHWVFFTLLYAERKQNMNNTVFMSFCAIAEAGQTLAQTTGCLDILLDVFRYCTILKTIKARQHFYLNANNTCFAGPHFPFPQMMSWEGLELIPVRTASFGQLYVVLFVDVSIILKTVNFTNVFPHWTEHFFVKGTAASLPFSLLLIHLSSRRGAAYLRVSFSHRKHVASADFFATYWDFSAHLFLHSDDSCQQL